MPPNRSDSHGARAEQIAEWFFRLNGFLGIPSFVVHPDIRQRYARTEADFIGVRFGCSTEWIRGRAMADFDPLLACAIDLEQPIPLFIIAEVTLRDCKINGPISNRSDGNVQRVLARLGAVPSSELDDAADAIYSTGRWENDYGAIQLVAVGRARSASLPERLLQITWKEIADFLYRRFGEFPEKLPTFGNPVHVQWPDFGRAFGEWFELEGRQHSSDNAVMALRRFWETGSCRLRDSSRGAD